MNMGLTIAAAIIALASPAVAGDFSGRWQGTGTATTDQGDIINCGGVLVTIAQTGTTFTISQRFSCDGTETAVPGGTLTISGDQLVSADGARGTITNTGFAITAKDGDSIVRTEASFSDRVLALSVAIAPNATPDMALMKVRAALMRGPASRLQPEQNHLALQ